MDENLKKMLNLGLGAIVITRDRIQSAIDELVEKGHIGRAESRELFNKLVEKGASAGRQIEETVKKAAAELELPTRKEFNKLKSEVEKLKEKLEK